MSDILLTGNLDIGGSAGFAAGTYTPVILPTNNLNGVLVRRASFIGVAAASHFLGLKYGVTTGLSNFCAGSDSLNGNYSAFKVDTPFFIPSGNGIWFYNGTALTYGAYHISAQIY